MKIQKAKEIILIELLTYMADDEFKHRVEREVDVKYRKKLITASQGLMKTLGGFLDTAKKQQVVVNYPHLKGQITP